MDHHGTHSDLHSEQGAMHGEHPGRAKDPVIKVRDLAWLEFTKRDLKRAEIFAHAFGFGTVSRTNDRLVLRGSDAGTPAVIIHSGDKSRYVGAAFKSADPTDLARLASATNSRVNRLPDDLGGLSVDLQDPSGATVRVVSETHELPVEKAQETMVFNFGHDVNRVNATQRPDRAPAKVQRLGHVVLQTTKYIETLEWYLSHLGMIVSDFKFFDGQRDLGPIMSFIRCDQGSTPTDHHTLALTIGPRNRYVHSAYQVADIDAMAAGGEYLREMGYYRSWGIGRHIEGSQIFDYWRDPDGFLVEHFSDGDMFDCTLEPGWSVMTASGLAQWGPAATPDFMGIRPSSESFREMGSLLTSLGRDNEFTARRLSGLLKVARS